MTVATLYFVGSSMMMMMMMMMMMLSLCHAKPCRGILEALWQKAPLEGNPPGQWEISVGWPSVYPINVDQATGILVGSS